MARTADSSTEIQQRKTPSGPTEMPAPGGRCLSEAADREAARGSVLIFAPTGRDAALTCEILQEAGVACFACATVFELCERVGADTGAVLLAEEALSPAARERIAEALDRQPPWSDLPIIVFAMSGEPTITLMETFGLFGNVTILERPVRIATLVSAVKAGLRARHRQYEVRDLLQRLEDAARRKDEFLAMLGHELRNPLAAIRNALQVMDATSPAQDKTLRQRGIIHRQSRALSRMVDDLLDVSRVTMGKIALQLQMVDLREVAHRSVQSMLTLAAEQQHTLVSDFCDEKVLLCGDPVRLEQVICNLLSNAIKYTPRGGHIRLSVWKANSEAVLSVQDNGIGIEPDMLSGVFELFTQAETSLARSPGGLGLGLTLVRTLVEMHGGSVVSTSEGPGLGSEFIVILPLSEDASVNGPAPGTSDTEVAPGPLAEETQGVRISKSGAPRHIVIIDDNDDIRETLKELLELKGHRVDVAEDGAEGVALILAVKPDVALVDIGLPTVSGYDVARQLRSGETKPHAYLIAITGYGRPSDHVRAIEAGFDDHLVKPVDPDALFALIDRIEIN